MNCVFAKPITVDELTNVVKKISEKHCVNILHSVALHILKRADLCAAKWRPLPTPRK